MEGSSNNLPNFGSVISNYNEGLSRVFGTGRDVKELIQKVENKFQFARDIFIYFNSIYKNLDISSLAHLKQCTEVEELALYVVANDAFKAFKISFTELITNRLDNRDIRHFTTMESCDDFLMKSNPPSMSVNFYQNFYFKFMKTIQFKFMRTIQVEPSPKRLKMTPVSPEAPVEHTTSESNPRRSNLDHLYHDSDVDPTLDEVQSYCNFNTLPTESNREKEKEKEKEEEEEESRDFGLLGFLKRPHLQVTQSMYRAPEEFVERELEPTCHLLVNTLAKNGEFLATTRKGKIFYWDTNFDRAPLNPRSHLPLENGKDMLMDSNSSFSVFAGESEVKIFGESTNGASLSQIERKPTQHTFSYFSAIKAVRLSGGIIALGHNNGSLGVYRLEKNHSVSPILEIKSKIKFQEFSERSRELVGNFDKDPFGTMPINSLDLSNDHSDPLVIAGGSHKTVFLGRLDGRASVVIRGFPTMLKFTQFDPDYFITGTKNGSVTRWDLRTQRKIYERKAQDELLGFARDTHGFYSIFKKTLGVFYFDMRLGPDKPPTWQFSKEGHRITGIAKDEDNIFLTGGNSSHSTIIRLSEKKFLGESLTS